MDIVAAIPVKPFGVAKARLGPEINPATRSRLGRAVAAHTALAAAEAGAFVVVVTGDHDVAQWAEGLGYQVIPEDVRFGTGLNGAAAAAVDFSTANGAGWAIIHADLPLVAPGDLAAVFAMLHRGPVLAPSYDGGTNVIAATGAPFPFLYGPASFSRHLASRPTATVLTRPGLAIDLDSPRDLVQAQLLGNDWISSVLAGERQPS
jgi:2-phospho-L-lactate guanylyltransferase